MKTSFTTLVLAMLATLSSAQTPTIVYAQAKRETHDDVYELRGSGGGTMHLDPAMANWFTVGGDDATSVTMRLRTRMDKRSLGA